MRGLECQAEEFGLIRELRRLSVLEGEAGNTNCEVGASGKGASSGEEKRGAIQEILKRENEPALAQEQMGNSKAERVHDSQSPALATEGMMVLFTEIDPWRRTRLSWKIKTSMLKQKQES